LTKLEEKKEEKNKQTKTKREIITFLFPLNTNVGPWVNISPP
jgi:hypothetical protein